MRGSVATVSHSRYTVESAFYRRGGVGDSRGSGDEEQVCQSLIWTSTFHRNGTVARLAGTNPTSESRFVLGPEYIRDRVKGSSEA